MNRPAFFLLATLAVAALPGCKSGGSSATCEFTDPATLATSSWPKYRHDLQNTGAISDVSFAASPAIRATYTAPSDLGSSPTLGNGSPTAARVDLRVYIGAIDGRIHALDADTLEELDTADFSFTASGPVRSTPLVALRAGAEALFAGSDDGRLYGLTQTGATQTSFWPFNYGALINASPTINETDGTVYIGAFNHLFAGVCPNGIERFSFSTTGTFESSPAIGANGLIVAGGGDRILRGFYINGFTLFSVATAAPVRNAPVVELDRTADPPVTAAIYVVDESGSLLKLTATGQTVDAVQLPIGGMPATDGAAVPSPALALDHLYVADPTGGALLAINKDTLAVDWQVSTGGPIVSSPAVALRGTQRTVVVGSDDGNLYFIEDRGASAGMIATVDVGAPLRTSPALRRHSDGSGAVYIATTDQRLLLIQ